MEDVLDDILEQTFSVMSSTLDHVLCPQKETCTYPFCQKVQAEAIFHFQINGCMTINRLMLKNKCRDWHTIQQTIDRFIRAGLEAFLG